MWNYNTYKWDPEESRKTFLKSVSHQICEYLSELFPFVKLKSFNS